MRLTGNFLVGLTRHPEITQRFPFLQTLAHKYRVNVEQDCSTCGQKRSRGQFTSNINEAAKILATLPESEVAVFKQMAKISDKITVSYMDPRGQTITTEI